MGGIKVFILIIFIKMSSSRPNTTLLPAQGVGGTKRTPQTAFDPCVKANHIYFVVSQILERATRRGILYYHVEWEQPSTIDHPLPSTWEPETNLPEIDHVLQAFERKLETEIKEEADRNIAIRAARKEKQLEEEAARTQALSLKKKAASRRRSNDGPPPPTTSSATCTSAALSADDVHKDYSDMDTLSELDEKGMVWVQRDLTRVYKSHWWDHFNYVSYTEGSDKNIKALKYVSFACISLYMFVGLKYNDRLGRTTY